MDHRGPRQVKAISWAVQAFMRRGYRRGSALTANFVIVIASNFDIEVQMQRVFDDAFVHDYTT